MGALEHIIKVLEYPGEPEILGGQVCLWFDGLNVLFSEAQDGVELRYGLKGLPESGASRGRILSTLLGYCLGRGAMEDWVLSCEPEVGGEAFIWGRVSFRDGDMEVRRQVERYLSSCEWWQERVDSMVGDEAGKKGVEASSGSVMFIRP